MPLCALNTGSTAATNIRNVLVFMVLLELLALSWSSPPGCSHRCSDSPQMEVIPPFSKWAFCWAAHHNDTVFTGRKPKLTLYSLASLWDLWMITPKLPLEFFPLSGHSDCTRGNLTTSHLQIFSRESPIRSTSYRLVSAGVIGHSDQEQTGERRDVFIWFTSPAHTP